MQQNKVMRRIYQETIELAMTKDTVSEGNQGTQRGDPAGKTMLSSGSGSCDVAMSKMNHKKETATYRANSIRSSNRDSRSEQFTKNVRSLGRNAL